MCKSNVARSRLPIDAHEVLSHYISLGDNCEFGLVQRRAGVEQPSLFRFSSSPIGDLIEALDDQFADLDPLECLSLTLPWSNEYITSFGTRGFSAHTFVRADSVDAEKFRKSEVARITFLRRRMIEDLCAAEKTFVRKSRKHAPEEMRYLHKALQKYGPNSLLWVELSDATHPPGSVEMLGDGLIRGYVDRFAPYGDATAISFESWLRLCATAYQHEKHVIPMAKENTAQNAVKSSDQLRELLAVSSKYTSEIEKIQDEMEVFKHYSASPVSDAVVLSPPLPNMIPSEVYTASIWVWLPATFRGKLVAPALTNTTHPFTQPAVMQSQDCWQRMWVSGNPEEDRRVHSAIWADMEAGDFFYSSSWTIERGSHPSSYLLLSKE